MAWCFSEIVEEGKQEAQERTKAAIIGPLVRLRQATAGQNTGWFAKVKKGLLTS
jgi:hypothetical protein